MRLRAACGCSAVALRTGQALLRTPGRAAGCSDIRNRNMQLLARSSLKLQSLIVGHGAALTATKPRITNLVRRNTRASYHASNVGQIAVDLRPEVLVACASRGWQPSRS